MKFIELDEHLKKGISSFYVISGEDAYCRTSAAEKIVAAAHIALPEINFTETESNVQAVMEAAVCLPVMSERRVVKAREVYPSQSQTEIIKGYLKSPNEGTTVIIVNENKSLIEKLKGAVSVDCSKLETGVLVRWITADLKRSGKLISPENALSIAEYCLKDMSMISLETEKLSNSGEREITREIIEKLVSRETDYSVFELTDKIALKDVKGAMEILDGLLSAGVEPVYILGSVYSFFRRMFYSVNSKGSGKEEIAAALGVKEGAVTFAMKKGNLFGAVKLRKLMKMCLEADYDIKTSAADKEGRLRMLIIRACM